MGQTIHQILALRQQQAFLLNVFGQLRIGRLQLNKSVLQIFSHHVKTDGKPPKLIIGLNIAGRSKIQSRHSLSGLLQFGNRLGNKAAHQKINGINQQHHKNNPNTK